MLETGILELDRAELARRIAAQTAYATHDPLLTTPWIAMSLLQKAIRRGRSDLALRAAATLIVDSPDRLWRRLGLIAFEDIGAADPATFSLVTAALGGKRIRAKLGGEWAVASALVKMMAAAPKCRAADDLISLITYGPKFATQRQAFAGHSMQELRRIVLGPEALPERALALWFILGTDVSPSPFLPTRRGEPAFALDVLDELGTPMTVIETAREAFRRLRSPLHPLVGLLLAEAIPTDTDTADDEPPSDTMLGPLPSWALDWFTREGRRAMARFLAKPSDTAEWLLHHIPAAERTEFLGNLVFFTEGSLLCSRLQWPLGLGMRCAAERACLGPRSDEVIALLRNDLPLLNAERSHAC